MPEGTTNQPTAPTTPTGGGGAGPQPWEQQTGEPARHFEAFRMYRDMGRGRTVAGAYRQYIGRPEWKGRPKSWLRYAVLWSWKERAEQYDRWLDGEARQAQAAATAAAATRRAEATVDWDGRRAALRDEEWELRGRLLAKVRAMLDIALVQKKTETRTEQGGRVVHVTTYAPAKWSFFTVCQMVETLGRLGRMAAEMPITLAETDSGGGADAPYFETSGQVADALPEGVMPGYPVNTAEKPEVSAAARRQNSGILVPSPSRPAGPAGV